VVFRQLINEDLGCASYLLGDAGEAVVVDPRLDIGVYLEGAAEAGLRITAVLDTHIHADHVSGREALAAATGARAFRPGDGGTLTAGTAIEVGALRLVAEAAPGHRPEHLAILVADTSRGSEPWLVLTGDSLLVGDLARPDLAVDAAVGARDLHATVARIAGLGDGVEVWPGHVGGSLCGGAGLSGKTSSTIGYERRHNPLLGAGREDFVERLIKNLPPKPPNGGRIVELNRSGAASVPTGPAALALDQLAGALGRGARVMDGRSAEDFDRGHLRGAIWLPPGRATGTRAGWVVDPEDELVIVADGLDRAARIAAALQAVGLWKIAGLSTSGADDWAAADLPIARGARWDLDAVAAGLRAAQIALVDVRDEGEWDDGHVPGSISLPLHQLTQAGEELGDGDLPIAVACAGGTRAAFAASVLRHRLPDAEIVRVVGGGIAGLAERDIALTAPVEPT
jgi:hydroxyacylglutathione hydrolase